MGERKESALRCDERSFGATDPVTGSSHAGSRYFSGMVGSSR